MQHKLWLVFFYFEILWSFAHAKCYFPNGKEMFRPGVEFFECNSTQKHTMCCGKGDRCRPDGLCDSIYYGLVFRNGCSDPTWQSPSCVKLCDTGFLDVSVWNGEVKDLSNSGVPVTLCDDGSYCCGDGTTAQTCCASRQGVFLRNGSSIPHYPVPSSAISVPISTVSVTLVESLSVSVTVTTTFPSSEIPTGLPAASGASSTISPGSSSSSANKSLDKPGAFFLTTIIGGVWVVLLVLIFESNWRAPS